MSKAIVNILKNDSALTTLLGSNDKIRTNTIAQSVKKPYVIVDIEDSNPTNTFREPSDLDFVRLTISSVADRAYTNANGVGVTEIAAAVRTAIDYVAAGTYNGETIARCTFQRSGYMHEDRMANNVQFTKEDEYLVTINRAIVGLPTLLSATLYGYNVIDLAWTDGTVGTSDSYEIWRAENGGAFSLLGTTTNADSYRDSSITGDSSRYFNYKVRALTGANYSLFGNESGLVTTELRPQLLLDARDVDANIIASGVDDRSVAILDQSEGLAETNVYTSDFSVNENGWLGTEGVALGNEIINSEGGWLKYYANDTALTSHHLRQDLVITGKTYKISGYYFLESGQSNLNSILIDTVGDAISSDLTVFDTKTYFEYTFLAPSARVFFRAKANGQQSFTGANDPNDDRFYIKDVVINEIQGSHFTQTISANRGLVDSATVPTQISYDGVSDYSENTLDVAKFAAMGTGSVVYISKVSGANQIDFGLAATSSNSNYFQFGNNVSKAFLIARIAGVNNIMESSADISDDDVIEWRSNGSVYTLLINGIDSAINEGAYVNDGRWFDSPNALDNMSIGALIKTSSVYRDTTFKHLMIRSTPLTDAESKDYANYLIEKHESI
jgi:hypothetical protein